MILKWQGYGENLQIGGKKKIQLSFPIIVWLYFPCRVEWILVILPLIPFSSHVLTFVVSADGPDRLWMARIIKFPEQKKLKNGSLESWCPFARLFATLCFSFLTVKSLLGDILLFILMEKGFETLKNSSNHLKYGFHVSWVNKKVK